MVDRRTPALRDLAAAGITVTVHEYRHDPRANSYGIEAADSLGVAPERVFKTLIARVDGSLVVAVVPVHCQLDLRALAAHRGAKRAELADAASAQRSSGYVVGGISPVGQRTALATVIDASASRQATVLVSAGRRGLEVEIAPDDLVSITDATLGDIARGSIT